MHLKCLWDVFQRQPDEEALIWQDRAFSYGWLGSQVERWRAQAGLVGMPPGSVVVVEGDFSPSAVAVFLGLVEAGQIVVPLTSASSPRQHDLLELAQAEFLVQVGADDAVCASPTGRRADHELYRRLRNHEHPGLVLFSSGSTGHSKGVVHDLVAILEKFHTPRQKLRTLPFLMYDHIGGVNTMLYTLCNGGCLITVPSRNPDVVLAAIARHRVELMPTTPTFLNLVLLSEAYRRHDLSSLRTVTYGTEPMPESTLTRFHQLFPAVRLQQTYGLSEVGILRSKSLRSDSLWVRIGGEGFETRVVDGVLQIRARSAMLGYLNAPNPFTADGWLVTGDAVEQDGEYVRFLGRKSEIINVGGEKVYPAEVESVLLQMPHVQDVAVYGIQNPITGQIVAARVELASEEDLPVFRKRMREFCRVRLPPYKIPARVEFSSGPLYGDRMKKQRGVAVDSASAGA